MPSLLPGYEYDLFISYRHNDNLNGWVTEFVQNLEKELKGTLKDSVSIYFDTNPHDGLLETHDVDKSLSGKLKCLIFIPVISQTYCDPKSFAWQHEFRAFNKLAKADPIGRDIRLSNGNVASRILPIKIHNLDAEDKALLENELGGVLRPIEFIFNASGVNRPLEAHEDRPNDNTNHTVYRDQVNKVANAVKDIITGLKAPAKQPATPSGIHKPSQKSFRVRLVIVAAFLVALLIAGYYGLSGKLFGSKADITDKSIAVLAFKDLSPGHDQEWFSDGVSEEILNSLSRLKELKVMARTSSFYFKGRNATITEIGEKLGVAHVVEGSVKKVGNQLRITAQLIRASDGIHLWSDEYDRPADSLLNVQRDIAEQISRALLKTLSQNDRISIASEKPSNPNAYEHFLKGNFFHEKYRTSYNRDNFKKAEREFLDAIAADPSYAAAYGELANLYDTDRIEGPEQNDFLRDSLADLAYRLNPRSTSALAVKALSFMNTDTPNFDSAFYYVRQAYRIYPEDAWTNGMVGLFYHFVGLPDLEEGFRRRSIARDPLSASYFHNMASSQYFSGDMDAAKASIQKILELDSTNLIAYYLLGCIAAENKDANGLERVVRVMRKMERSEIKALVDTMEGCLLAVRGDKKGAMKLRLNDQHILGTDQRLIYYYLFDDKENLITLVDSVVTLDPATSYQGLQQRKIFEPIRSTDRFQKLLQRVKEKDAMMRRKYGVVE